MSADRRKIFLLVESPLGIGNIRMVESTIRQLLQQDADVTVATGLTNEKIELVNLAGANVIRLPSIEFDSVRKAVITANGTFLEEDEDYQARRATFIINALEREKPDAIVTQFYPVGRAYLDAELYRVFEHVRRDMDFEPVVLSLLRDIYFETDRNRHRRFSANNTLSGHYHGAIVYGDQNFIGLEQSWPDVSSVLVPVNYAGYSALPPPPRHDTMQDTERDVVVAAGGQLTEETLGILKASIQARQHTKYAQHRWVIYIPNSEMNSAKHQELERLIGEEADDRVLIRPNDRGFLKHIANAAVVICQTGYSMFGEMAQTSTPVVFVPRVDDIEDDYREQYLRAKLASMAFSPQVQIATPQDILYPKIFAWIINTAAPAAQSISLNFNGSANAARFIIEYIDENRSKLAAQHDARQNGHESGVLGIDVGGTKTFWEVYAVVGGEVTNRVLANGHYHTRTALSDFSADMSRVFIEASGICNAISNVAVAFPGKLSPDGSVMSGSAPNMGRPKGEEFNNQNLPDLLRTAFPIRKIMVLNDAIAQLLAVVGETLSKPDKLTRLGGKTVGYFAPGTGLGGGFAQISLEGEVEIITDGHLHDMMITLPQDDMEFLNARNSLLSDEQRLIIRDSQIMAGDVLSGVALRKITGAAGESIDIGNLSTLQNTYICVAARTMARVIENIRTQNVTKEKPDQQWTSFDKEAASRTSLYFISGSMGTSPIGRLIVNRAKSLLERNGTRSIVFCEAKENKAAYGACVAAMSGATITEHNLDAKPHGSRFIVHGAS